MAGVLTLCRGADRPPMSPQELGVALSLARRAGMAIDNARLYAAQAAAAEHDRTVAQALQQALLTDLPQPDHLHLVARYLPAADGDQVGGDWYDSVLTPDGATTVMIGDVVGHDIAAAAVMGQLRTMLRMLALEQDQPPSQMLRRLDDAGRKLHLHTFASVVAARIEQSASDKDLGMRTLRWSNAGHPPPVLVTAEGDTHVLEADTADIVIGVAPERERQDHTCQLPPGSTLFLYSDGLIETRTHDIDHGLHRLQETLSRHHRKTPDDLLDAVLADMVGDRQDDDVAMLAIRLNPEDRPRPREAGPTSATSVTLPRDVTAPASARRFVEENCAHLDAGAVQDADLLVTEVVTNAVRYGHADIEVELQLSPSALHVAVTDTGQTMPDTHVAMPTTPTATSGRGLAIVEALALRWGVEPRPDGPGKTVWFELGLP